MKNIFVALCFFCFLQTTFAQADDSESSNNASASSQTQDEKFFDGIIPSSKGSVSVDTDGDGSVDVVATGNFKCEHAKYMDIGTKIQWGCVQLSDVPLIIVRIIDMITKLAGTAAVLLLLYAGIQMMISGVTEDKESAKKTIQYAIIGLVVTFSAWVIVNVVQTQLTS